MKKKKSSSILFLALISLNACSTFQSNRALVQKQIDSLLVLDFFKSSLAAISVYDLTNRKSVYEQNDKILFRPASNQKILTTAAALWFLGVDHKFSTSVFHSGEIKDSVCMGDIYILGGFDPEFTSKDLDSLTKEIRKFGIKQIKGNLYGDISAMDSLYWGNGWMWDDDPAAYMPYMSPLIIDKNCVTVFFKPGNLGNSVDISLSPENNFITIENYSVTVASGKSTLQVTRDWLNRKNKICISGNFPIESKLDSIQFNLVNPTFNFLSLVKKSLSKNQILLEGLIDTMNIKLPLTKIFSLERNIIPVISNANKLSDNLNAEMLLRELAHKQFRNHASAEKGKVFLDSLITLAGRYPKQYRLADGSGLSFYNLVSAELLVNVLKFIFEQSPEIKDEFANSLPIAGIDGTLASRFKNSSAKGHVYAKTGSLSGVNNLSGYIETLRGNHLAFSIMIQNFVGSSSQAREFQEKICEIFYKGL
jgi:serine-type D-Ala-D-Ala carboxypeptidase/endopeptidase (penicillin-binding protein 4)